MAKPTINVWLVAPLPKDAAVPVSPGGSQTTGFDEKLKALLASF